MKEGEIPIVLVRKEGRILGLLTLLALIRGDTSGSLKQSGGGGEGEKENSF